MPRIAILGGGLCGRLTALQLAEQGLSVALFDKGGRKSEHAAAYVAAAMLAPAAEAVEATPEVIKLGRQSIPLWRNIKGRLKTPTMMQENGSLIVWHGQDKPLSSEFVRHLKRGGVADDEIVRWRADDEDVVFFRGDVERVTRVQQANGTVERDFGRINPRHFAAYAAQGAGVCGGLVPRGFCAVAAAVDQPVVLGLQVFGDAFVFPMARDVQPVQSVGKCRQHLSSVELAFGRQVDAV